MSLRPHECLHRQLAEVITIEDLVSCLPSMESAMEAHGSLVFSHGQSGVARFVGGTLTTCMSDYTEHHYKMDPLHPFMRNVPPDYLTIATGKAFAAYGFEHSEVATDFYYPRGMASFLGVWPTQLRYGERDMFGVLLTRGNGHDYFDGAKLSQLRALRDDLESAGRRILRARAHAHLTEALSAEIEAGTATMAWDRDGRSMWCSRKAQAWTTQAMQEELGGRARQLLRDVSASSDKRGITSPLSNVHAGPNGLFVVSDFEIRTDSRGDAFVGVHLSLCSVHALRLQMLSKAETRVLVGLSEGKTNADIAAELFVSIETVRTHVRQILRKLDVKTRAQAGMVAKEVDAGQLCPN